MADIRSEFHQLAGAALAGDVGVASLIVAGARPQDLSWQVVSGELPQVIGGSTWSPAPPFHRETVINLLGRTLQRRWARYDPYTLSLVPPSDEDLDQIRKRYEHRGIWPGVGPGWSDLVTVAMQTAEEVEPEEWRILDCKQKYGTLRLYHSASGGADAVFEAAEHLSAFICEDCGAPGKLRNPKGWMRTLCDEHAVKPDA